MIRATLGVIVAFVLMVVLVLVLSMGLWLALGVDGVLRPGVFDGSALLDIYAVLAGVTGAIVAGWLCAKISRSTSAVAVFVALCFVMGTVNAVMQIKKPDPGARPPGLSLQQAIEKRKEPMWFIFLMPVLGSTSALLSGRRALGSSADR
jgi:hypothetical protein